MAARQVWPPTERRSRDSAIHPNPRPNPTQLSCLVLARSRCLVSKQAIFAAALLGREGAIRELLAQGANVNAPCGNGNSAAMGGVMVSGLFEACRVLRGHVAWGGGKLFLPRAGVTSSRLPR